MDFQPFDNTGLARYSAEAKTKQGGTDAYRDFETSGAFVYQVIEFYCK